MLLKLSHQILIASTLTVAGLLLSSAGGTAEHTAQRTEIAP